MRFGVRLRPSLGKENMESRQKFLFILVLIVVGIGLTVIVQINSLGKLRFIFCDVGQGDAILMITPSGREILVDGGPGSRVLGCLSGRMPFWNRTLDAVFLTHSQQDHMEGLVSVLANYKVKMIGTTGVKNETALFGAWQQAMEAEKSKIYTPKRGDMLIVDPSTSLTLRVIEVLRASSSRGSNVTIEILWPPAEKIGQWRSETPEDLNDSSVIMRVTYGQICAYLTGDIPKEILETVADKPCHILKVAHHGSRTGTNQEILDKVKPQIAVIQAGENNRFGHPHKEVVDLLNSKGIKTLRNDELGTFEVNTDGERLSIKGQK